MTVMRGFCIVLASAFLGAVIGLAIGYFLAITIPFYLLGLSGRGGNRASTRYRSELVWG